MGIVRLLLALAVVVGHVGPVFGRGTTQLTGGRVAVQLFYMISGFYMALVLTKKYTRTRDFYFARYFRLLPAYLAVLLITLVVSGLLLRYTGLAFERGAAIYSRADQLSITGVIVLGFSNLTMLGSDWVMFLGVDPGGALSFTSDFRQVATPAHVYLIIPQSWTLGIELTFYLIAPFLVRRSWRLIVALVAAGFLARLALFQPLGMLHDPWTYRFFPTELPMFLLGVLAFKYYDQHRASLSSKTAMMVWACVVLAVLGFAHLPRGTAAWRLFGIHWTYPLFVLALPWLFHASRRQGWDRWVGELSYPLYIGHIFVRTVVRYCEVHPKDSWFSPLVVLGSLGFAILLKLAVENPAEKWRAGRLAKALATRPAAQQT